jgi:uncharacterized protein
MRYVEALTHVFTLGEDHILLDINSGAVHSLSPLAYAAVEYWRLSGCRLAGLEDGVREDRRAGRAKGVGQGKAAGLGQEAGREATGADAWAGLSEASLALLQAAPDRDLAEIGTELADLVAEGMLMSAAPELASYVLPEYHVVKALCLHVAHDCNLRCRYCFAGAGAFGGRRELMTLKTGKQALDFLFAAAGDRKHVEVDYFGGEPLLNFPVVKELIDYGESESRRRGKILKQTLTTNGMLLRGEISEFLNQRDVALVLSLDGRKEVNDRMRPLINGQGSYDVILRHFQAAVAGRGYDNYYLRGTYTRFNLDFFQDVRHMVENGFDLISAEPVVAEPDEPYAFRREDLAILFQQYEALARYHRERRLAGQPFTFFHFNLDLDHGPCLPKRLSGCGAGREYLAVAPEGTLYPCHQFVGQPEFVVGDVERGIVRPEVGRRFQRCHVLAKEKCRACWARFYCGGGCHANAWNFNRDLSQPYDLGCELEKKRLEWGIWLKVKEAEDAES